MTVLGLMFESPLMLAVQLAFAGFSIVLFGSLFVGIVRGDIEDDGSGGFWDPHNTDDPRWKDG